MSGQPTPLEKSTISPKLSLEDDIGMFHVEMLCMMDRIRDNDKTGDYWEVLTSMRKCEWEIEETKRDLTK